MTVNCHSIGAALSGANVIKQYLGNLLSFQLYNTEWQYYHGIAEDYCGKLFMTLAPSDS